jgi:hypothetical protein
MTSAATPRRWWWVALTASAVLLLAGCGLRSARQVDGGSSTSSSGPTTTADPRPAIVAAYRGFWADVIEAGKTADADSPRLDDHATDRALDNLRNDYRRLRANGEVVRGTVRLHPRVASVSSSTAIVSDCNDVTDFLRYDAKTGAPREQRKADIAEVEVTLRLVDGKWLVSKTVVKQPCKP